MVLEDLKAFHLYGAPITQEYNEDLLKEPENNFTQIERGTQGLQKNLLSSLPQTNLSRAIIKPGLERLQGLVP